MNQKINDLIKEMTLFEKASILSGFNFWQTKEVPRLGIPSITTSDGPHGLRKENNDDTGNVALKNSFPATAFPPAVNMASTWNPSLIKKVGKALGEQCKNQEIDVLLGPGTNIKRSPLCGRNFEYFSEDPYLAGKMCVSYIDGIQSVGVGASLKHFAVNSQEYLRMTINEVVDERSFREIYLSAFEMAVKESKPKTVMCSYNKINGTYSSDNKHLLTEILRDEWGFDGLVVSDWNALNDRVKGVIAGMDLEMPSSGGKTDKQLVDAVLTGKLDESEIDKCVYRVLRLIFESVESREDDYFYNYKDGHRLARKVADESMVLLKNENKALPLEHNHEIAVIGALAEYPRYQGAGSSRINPYTLVGFLDYLRSHNLQYEYAPGYTLMNDGYNEKLYNDAIALAKTREKVVIFAGLTDSYESEGYDRKHLSIPECHIRLINEISKFNKNLIVVLFGGSPVEMPWIDNVSAVLNAYLPGEGGGEAVADVLFGIVNPSGKLAETYPIKLDDFIGNKYYRGGPKNVEHREGIYIGYRYFDSAKKDVLFPFGYGLSYTEFEYSDIKLSATDIKDTDTLEVSFTVKNIGDVDGAEVAQIYVRDPESAIFKAEKELKGFEKVFLTAGESKRVTITLDKRSFSYYNTEICDWHVESGEYEILVGASSRDIKLSATVNVTDTMNNVPYQDLRAEYPTYYNIGAVEEISEEEYHKLVGGEILPNVASKRGEFDKNTTIGEMKCCLAGKVFMMIAPGIIKGQMPDADLTTMLMLQQGMEEMPMRALGGVTSGLLDDMVMDGLIMWGNKHRMKGLCKIIAGLFKSFKNIKITRANENKLSSERKKLKEEEARINEECNAEIERQRQSLIELKEDLEKLKKLANKETQYDEVARHIAKQEESIANQKKDIADAKAAKKENIESFKERKRAELKIIKDEQKKINKALKSYADTIEKEEKLDSEKKSILSAIMNKIKANDEQDKD